jgi:hypothetical protein
MDTLTTNENFYFKAFGGSSGFNGELDMSMVGLRLKFMNEFHHIHIVAK